MAIPALHTGTIRPFRPVDRTQLSDPGYQAFLVLRAAFTVAPPAHL